mgnify:FL=1
MPRIQDVSDSIQWDQYPDRGCEAAPRCLSCPLAQCRYDDPAAYQHLRRGDVEAHTLAAQGMKPSEIAIHQGVLVRTVYRRLARLSRYEERMVNHDA